MFKKVYIEITNICNLKCRFCPKTIRPQRQMSVKEFTKVINEVKNETNLVCLHVKGEPLLHSNLNDILKVIENNNLKCNITTNGTLLKEKINIINNSPAVRQINISLHSILQNSLDYKIYLENIFSCVDKINNIIISYRLWNLKTIKENDINKNIIQMLESHYNVNNLKDKLTKQEFIKLKDNIFINQDTEFTWPDIKGPVLNEKGKCLALKDQIAFLVDGTVTPCCLDNNGDIKLGNIFEESLSDILNKPLSKEIKTNFSKGIITCTLCKTCGFLKRLKEKRKH